MDKYRQQKEEEDLMEEEARMAALSLGADGGGV